MPEHKKPASAATLTFDSYAHGSAAQKALDEKRKKAIEDSKAKDWMDLYRIPSQYGRAWKVTKKSKGKTESAPAPNPPPTVIDGKLAVPGATQDQSAKSYPVTASTVTMELLKKHYNWEDCKRKEDLEAVIPQTTAYGVESVMNACVKDAGDLNNSVIVIPDSWANPVEPSDEQLTRSTKMIPLVEELVPYVGKMLKNMQKQWEAVFKRKMPWPYRTVTSAESEPKFKNARHLVISELWDEKRFKIRSPFSPAWFLMLMRYTAPIQPDDTLEIPGHITESDVEKDYGHIIQCIFDQMMAKRLSNAYLTCPTLLSCFGSYPKPDEVGQMIDGVGTSVNLFRPIVLIAEAKKSLKANKDARAQMAMAVQPTLQMFAIHLSNKWNGRGNNERQRWSNNTNPCHPNVLNRPQIPSWMRVYGILYDAQGMEIFCYFPYYNVIDDDVKGPLIEWHFMCVPMQALDDRPVDLSHCFALDDTYTRHQAFVAFCILKDAANDLEKRFTMKEGAVWSDIELPKEFSELNKLWWQRECFN